MLCSLITLLDLTFLSNVSLITLLWSIGADTAGLEVVDVADAQHHDAATTQHHVAATARGKGGSKRKGGQPAAKGKRGPKKGKKAGAAKKKTVLTKKPRRRLRKGKSSTFQKAKAAFKVKRALKKGGKSNTLTCHQQCDSRCGKELEMDEVVALIEIDEEHASTPSPKQRAGVEQQKVDRPDGDKKDTAKAMTKQKAKKAEAAQVDKALEHAQVIKDKHMRAEAIAAAASAKAVATVEKSAAQKSQAVKETIAQADKEATIATGKMLQARMTKKEEKLKGSHEADEQKKLIDREVKANHEMVKDDAEKKAAKKKAAKADKKAAGVQRYVDRKVSETKLKQENQNEKIMQKAQAKVKEHNAETAKYKAQSAVLDVQLKAVGESLPVCGVLLCTCCSLSSHWYITCMC